MKENPFYQEESEPFYPSSGWYFWSEDYMAYGPFESKEKAKEALKEYCMELSWGPCYKIMESAEGKKLGSYIRNVAGKPMELGEGCLGLLSVTAQVVGEKAEKEGTYFSWLVVKRIY